MNTAEARFEITRLSVRQKQLETEILDILNNGCLPLEEAREKIKTDGIETKIWEGAEYVVITTPEGKKGYTPLPAWYPQYATMDDVFESIEINKATIKALKEKRAERLEYERAWGIKPIDDNGYIAAHEKVLEKIGEYLINKNKIEELTEALDRYGSDSKDSRAGHQENTETTEDIKKKIDHTLAILMEGHFIDGKRQALKTLPEIQTELKVKKLVDKIDIPKTDQIDDFILKYIKTREGKSFSGALRQDRHRQKTK